MMVRVEGALYGFPESGKRWFDCLSKFLIESGYQQTDKRLIAELIKKIEDRFGKVKKKQDNVIPFLGMRI